MLYAIALAVVLLLNILLALFVLAKNHKNHINISFTLFVFATVLWMLTNYLSNLITQYDASFLFNKFIFIFTPYMVLGLLYFAIVFPRNLFTLTKLRLLLLFIPIVLVNCLTFFNLVITGITYLKTGGTGVTFGPGIILFTVVFIGYLLYSICILLYKFIKSTGHEKAQLQYLIFGIMILMFSGTVTNLIIPLIFNSFWVSNIGPFFSIAVFGFTAYAIVRHRLLDIRLVVARSVAYIILLTLLATFYSGSLYLLGHAFFSSELSATQTLIYILLALFTAFTFQPLRVVIEKYTDKVFFRNNYSVNDLLFRLNKIMATTLRLDDLASSLLHELLQTMHITRGAFVVFSGNTIFSPITEGMPTQELANYAILSKLESYQRLLILEEEQDEQVKTIMRQYNISVCMPFYTRNEAQGILVLGEKKSGDMYSNHDIRLLEIFGPEASVAIQNTKAYEEIKRFNITLSEKVEKATTDLRHANTRLEQLDKLKDDFVSVASHELRTPMTAIKSYLWMALNKRKKELSADLTRYLDNAYLSVDRLINLVNDMLNVSRIEGGRIALKLAPTDIIGLAKEVAEEVLPRAAERKIEVVVKDAKVPEVLCDKDKIHEVFLNLIGNSLKFTQEKGKITVSFSVKAPFVLVNVTDNGHGISKEDLSRLFTKFGRLDNSYVSMAESGGTGLGLYITKSLIALHKGTVEAQSKGIGKGSQFSFTLPITGSAIANQLVNVAPKVQQDTKELEKTNVLL